LPRTPNRRSFGLNEWGCPASAGLILAMTMAVMLLQQF
jgi:hypothetical protein